HSKKAVEKIDPRIHSHSGRVHLGESVRFHSTIGPSILLGNCPLNFENQPQPTSAIGHDCGAFGNLRICLEKRLIASIPAGMPKSHCAPSLSERETQSVNLIALVGQHLVSQPLRKKLRLASVRFLNSHCEQAKVGRSSPQPSRCHCRVKIPSVMRF